MKAILHPHTQAMQESQLLPLQQEKMVRTRALGAAKNDPSKAMDDVVGDNDVHHVVRGGKLHD